MTMKLETTLPEDFTAEYSNGVLKLGNGEEVEKKLDHALVNIEVDGDTVVFSTDSHKRNVKSILRTFQAHLENMIEGLENGHTYRMKGVYAHFPMTIKQESGKVRIENFMGERAPREIEIMDGVEVSVNGDDLEITGADKDRVAQTAARIEQECFKGDRDPRTFQDGVYIVKGDAGE